MIQVFQFNSNTIGAITDRLKVAQTGLKKGGYNFSYDSTSDWKKESSVNESKEKCTS